MSIQFDSPRADHSGDTDTPKTQRQRAGAKDARAARGRTNENLTSIIEGAIIPRLFLAHQTGARGDTLPRQDAFIDAGSAEVLARMSVVSSFDEMRDYVDEIASRGVSLDRIYIDLLTPAARILGVDWEEDRRSFTDVTIGLCHLHQLLHEFSRRLGMSGLKPASGHKAYFSPVPGEQHTFGLIMLNDTFRRRGWDTMCDLTAEKDQILNIVQNESFDLIGFTISGETFLDPLRSLIQDVRTAARNEGILIMVGGQLVMKNPELCRFVNADAMAMDALQALSVCDAAFPVAKDA